MKKFGLSVLLVGVILSSGLVIFQFYGYLFAKTVNGEIMGIERVNLPTAILGVGDVPTAQMFSFAIAIKDPNGEIFTASSEDRQWAVANKGLCAEAKFFPYPPWNLEKGGTFHGARLVRLTDCKNGRVSDAPSH